MTLTVQTHTGSLVWVSCVVSVELEGCQSKWQPVHAQVASEEGAAYGLRCSLGRGGRPGAGLESQGDLGIQRGGTLNDGRLRGMNAFLSLMFSSEISLVPLRTENQGCLFNYKSLLR